MTDPGDSHWSFGESRTASGRRHTGSRRQAVLNSSCPSPQGARTLSTRPLALALGPAAAAAVLLLTGCGSSDTDPGHGHEGSAGQESHLIGHVHGIGTDPADGTVYLAGHFGVFRIDAEGTPTRVADRWQDTMAFTVTGPHTFLASGHPDMREDLPPHLGLIESTDAAESWQPLSLQGAADFHALEAVGGRVFGYDSTSGRLMTTTDRTSWTTLAEGQFLDLAAIPGVNDKVLATTPSGELVAVGLDGTTARIGAAPPLVWIDSAPASTFVGITAVGVVYSTHSLDTSWTLAGSVAGQPGAIDAADKAWYVATDQGIFASTDQGRQWAPLVQSEE